MSKTVSIPLYMEAHGFETSDNNPIVFPEKCVYCCGPKEKTHNELKVDPPVGSVKKTLATRIPVPFCRKHFRLHWWYFASLLWLSFLLSMACVAGLYYLLKNPGASSSTKFLIGAASFFGGLLGGMILTGIVKKLLALIFTTMKDLSLLDIFTRTGSLGFTNAISEHTAEDSSVTYTYDCTFSNEQYAEEFEAMNTHGRAHT